MKLMPLKVDTFPSFQEDSNVLVRSPRPATAVLHAATAKLNERLDNALTKYSISTVLETQLFCSNRIHFFSYQSHFKNAEMKICGNRKIIFF